MSKRSVSDIIYNIDPYAPIAEAFGSGKSFKIDEPLDERLAWINDTLYPRELPAGSGSYVQIYGDDLSDLDYLLEEDVT